MSHAPYVSTNTIADRLAAHFSAFDYSKLTPANRKSVKRLLLDYLGVAVSGSQSESGQVARKFAGITGGHPQSTLIGGSEKVPAMQAAFANAISSHSIELDDIDVLALFHFSPPVYSSSLATAEQVGASGKDLLVALAAGCEMMERLSKAANSSLRNRGFHTTPTTGVFGATIAAAKLQGLEVGQIVSALGMAGASASGLMEMYGPSMQKRFNPGPAARNGVTAATMAGLGFTGAATIFEAFWLPSRTKMIPVSWSPTWTSLTSWISSSSPTPARARSITRSIARWIFAASTTLTCRASSRCTWDATPTGRFTT